MDASAIGKSLALFIAAGLAEIGGGYLMWQWLRAGQSIWIGLLVPDVLRIAQRTMRVMKRTCPNVQVLVCF